MDNVMDLRIELNSVDGEIIKNATFDDCESWTTLMLSFADFLSAQYGYGISERVLFITDHPFGRDVDYAISKKEYEMVLQHRKRTQALDSLFEDDDQ